MNFLENLKLSKENKVVPEDIYQTLFDFFLTYQNALNVKGHSIEEVQPILNIYLDLVIQQIKTPYIFDLYHSQIRSPFDYYQFGLDFLRPLVIFEKSKTLGLENIEKAESFLKKGENVIIFANHQTEPDPQAISLLLENSFPTFAEKIIFVAGNRVTSDPLAVPFSLGRNLLCIFSKKHIDHIPEEKEKKLQHNKKVMQTMEKLLREGGKSIYVAPSGGRDRVNADGQLEIAPFDPQSIEMFYLIAKKSQSKTHFFPLSLSTYHLLPPPNSIKKDLGETRLTNATPIHLYFGEELSKLSDMDLSHNKEARAERTKEIYKIVEKNYHTLTSNQV